MTRDVPRFGWVLGFLAAILIVVVAAFGYLYHGYRQQLDTELGQRLVAVASASSAAVNGDVWLLLSVRDAVTLDALRTDLGRVRETNGVSNIFLIDEAGNTLFDLSGRYPVGEPNLAADLDLVQFAAALTGEASYTRLTSIQGAFLKTGYAPVFDADHRVIGAVGVEASAAFLNVLTRVRRTLFGAVLGVLIAIVLLGAGFARLLGSQQRLETRLQRTETLATMGQMTAMLAHEIRNPLGIIRGAAERVAARHGLAEDEVLSFIPEEVDRLESTLSTYLQFARPHGSDGVGNLRRAIERTLELLAHEFERKGIAVTVDMQEEPCWVPVDEHFLQQVVLNVVLNATEAMPQGGRLSASLHSQGARATAAFEDTGVGMSESVRRQATEPFFTSKEKGSGLGLAVVRRVVEEAKGKMELTSRPGEGTRISVTLPLGSAPEEQA